MESTEAAATFAALAQETRLDLMRLLIGESPNGLPASDIAGRETVGTFAYEQAHEIKPRLLRQGGEGRGSFRRFHISKVIEIINLSKLLFQCGLLPGPRVLSVLYEIFFCAYGTQ